MNFQYLYIGYTNNFQETIYYILKCLLLKLKLCILTIIYKSLKVLVEFCQHLNFKRLNILSKFY